MNPKPLVIYENNDFLVLDKPWGMVVNKADTTENLSTLQAWVESYLKLSDLGIGGRAGIVHRLDKDTSGVIVVAKTEETFFELQRQFKEREILKKYTALAHGKVEVENGVINAPIERNPFNRARFGVFPGGREAVTEYRLVNKFQIIADNELYKEYKRLGGLDFSLLELTPHTGRTHQIRVHLKHIGHPIVSDEFYAGRKLYGLDSKWCARQFLHASYIRFKGSDGELNEFSSPLPDDLISAINFLG